MRRPFQVIRSGSPGPAPTRYTLLIFCLEQELLHSRRVTNVRGAGLWPAVQPTCLTRAQRQPSESPLHTFYRREAAGGHSRKDNGPTCLRSRQAYFVHKISWVLHSGETLACQNSLLRAGGIFIWRTGMSPERAASLVESH